jgi:hypothetical protein
MASGVPGRGGRGSGDRPQIAGNQERCLHILFFFETLIEQPDAADPTTEAQAS